MAISTGQTSVTTSAVKLFQPSGDAPIQHALVYSSAAAYIGPSGVTTSTGFPIPATTVVQIPLTGAETGTAEAVYAITSSSATVSYFLVS
ncbi:MAG TPA: hypothetical protein VMC78_10065 [Mycobacterium sp.]|nr:hypothetical protein [Mycobacterium sp.]